MFSCQKTTNLVSCVTVHCWKIICKGRIGGQELGEIDATETESSSKSNSCFIK